MGSVHFYLSRLYNTDDGASVSRSSIKWLENWLMNRHFVTPTQSYSSFEPILTSRSPEQSTTRANYIYLISSILLAVFYSRTLKAAKPWLRTDRPSFLRLLRLIHHSG